MREFSDRFANFAHFASFASNAAFALSGLALKRRVIVDPQLKRCRDRRVSDTMTEMLRGSEHPSA